MGAYESTLKTNESSQAEISDEIVLVDSVDLNESVSEEVISFLQEISNNTSIKLSSELFSLIEEVNNIAYNSIKTYIDNNDILNNNNTKLINEISKLIENKRKRLLRDKYIHTYKELISYYEDNHLDRNILSRQSVLEYMWAKYEYYCLLNGDSSQIYKDLKYIMKNSLQKNNVLLFNEIKDYFKF